MTFPFLAWFHYITGIVSVKDAVEILFFSTIIYYILLWLKKDTERNLMLGFYVYCAVFFGAYFADLPVIRFTLFLSSPVIALLFIIFHQETLQKQYVKIAKNTVPHHDTNPWVDELIKSCLMALNRHKEIMLVIERADLLKTLIHAPYFIYAELKRDVFDILLEKQIPGNDHMIWINQQGKLVAINASWRTHIDETWVSSEVAHLHPWKQHALFITAKTDALIFKVNPLTRNFDLVIQGKIMQGITAEQLSVLMKKHLFVPKKPTKVTEKVVAREEQPPQKSL